MGQFFSGVVKAASEIAGFDANKVANAFNKEMINAAQMGIDAVHKSRATSAKSIINMAIEKGNLSEDAVKGLKETLKGSRKEIIEEAGKIAEKSADIQDEVFKKAASEFHEKTGAFQKAMETKSAADVNAFLGKEGDKLSPLTKLQGFYGNEELGTTRKVLVRGGVVGAAVGARILSGGNLTTNARGEHDIAGIPFF